MRHNCMWWFPTAFHYEVGSLDCTPMVKLGAVPFALMQVWHGVYTSFVWVLLSSLSCKLQSLRTNVGPQGLRHEVLGKTLGKIRYSQQSFLWLWYHPHKLIWIHFRQKIEMCLTWILRNHVCARMYLYNNTMPLGPVSGLTQFC